MDGILSAINTVIPLVSENNLITGRGDTKNPPVEVAPVPENSFKSDSVASEALKNAYTLSLDIKGYKNDAASANSQRAGGTKTGATGKTPLQETIQGKPLDEAFTLSLGSGEELQLSSESMREMLRLKNYEMLGKTGGRKVIVKNPEMPPAEAKELQGNEAASAKGRADTGSLRSMASSQVAKQEAELLDPLLSQIEEKTQQPVQNGIGREPNRTAPMADNTDELLQNMQRGLRPEEELQPHASAPSAAKYQAGVQQQGLTDPEHIQQYVVNNPLSADITAGKLNEPALSETALPTPNGLQTEKAVITPNGLTEEQFNLLLFDKKAQNSIESSFKLSFSTADRAKNPQISTVGDQFEEQLGGLRAAALNDPELSRITGDILTAARSSETLQTVAGGSMANLRKITELPYALYIFGHVNEKLRGSVLDEENDAVIQEETESKPQQSQAGLLRISETIKMAAVLHNIYYGGDGKFEDEYPWYWPYVSYALKHGIIQVDDFTDFNSYATKAETAYIYSRSVPEAEFAVINYIPFIPDVTEDGDWGERIYLLFRAGVLTKTDGSGRFYPDRLMTRTEAAAVIGRIATPEDRKTSVKI